MPIMYTGIIHKSTKDQCYILEYDKMEHGAAIVGYKEFKLVQDHRNLVLDQLG